MTAICELKLVQNQLERSRAVKRNETEQLTDGGRGDNTSAMWMVEVERCGWIEGRERAMNIGDHFPKLHNCRFSAEPGERIASRFIN